MPVLTWVNGRFVSPGEPCLEAGERGFLYGDGLFETAMICDGRIIAWPQHAARLAGGCRTLGIPYPGQVAGAGLEAVLAALHEGRADGGGGCASLRLTVTRGANPPGARRVWPCRDLLPTVAITAYPGEPYPPDAYRRGQRAITVSFPRNHLSPTARLKSLNCLENLLGRREAAASGADEGIFFNLRGELAEGTVSNIFLYYDNFSGGARLVTPPVESGLLPGIARSAVLAVAGALGLAVGEEPIHRSEIGQAGEAFLTNSLMGVMPLVSLDGAPIGGGRPGEVSSAMLKAYREFIMRPIQNP